LSIDLVVRSSNRKSERSTVNEMKPALFAQTDKDRFVTDAGAEIFATTSTLQAVTKDLESPNKPRSERFMSAFWRR